MHLCFMKFLQAAFSAIFLLLFWGCFISCRSDESVNARIYERKQLDNNQLMIKYKYKFQSQEFVDSSTIENTVLEGDTITVRVDKNNPQKSKFDLSK